MRYLAAVLNWMTLATLFGLGFSFSPLRLTTATSATALAAALGIVIASFSWKHGKGSLAGCWQQLAPVQVAVILGFAAFALRAFLGNIFVSDESVRVLSPNNLGDVCLHLTQINFLARGPTFWPANPIFAFDKLHYPIGINLFNAELKLLGIAPRPGIILVGLLGSVLILCALLKFNGAFGVSAFLFNGGLIGFTIFHTLIWKDYQADVAWKSIPLAMFVTQRGLLYAIPAGLLLLTHWRSLFFERTPGWTTLPFWTECLLYFSLPLFHLHTFIFLSWFLLCWFLFGAPRWRPHLLRLVLVSFVPATLLVYFVTGFEKANSLGWCPGWMAKPGEPVWQFWLINFGLFLPLSLALLIYLLRPTPPINREERRLLRLFAFPAAGVLVACAFIKFAPWEWDNTKLIFWAYIVLMFCLWRAFLARWPVSLRIATMFVLFFSGFVSVIGDAVSNSPDGYQIGLAPEWKSVEEALKRTSPEAVFAGYPTYNHPALVTGHRMVMGFPGHLWSHGLNYRPVEIDLNLLMAGSPDWRQVAQRLRVDYLFWGNFEQREYPQSKLPWKKECPVIAEGDWGKVFDLRRQGGG